MLRRGAHYVGEEYDRVGGVVTLLATPNMVGGAR